MAKILYINHTVHEYRAALVENGRVVDFFMDCNVEKGGALPVRAGNIYRGRVSKIRLGIGAAFIDIGSDRTAFLYLEQPSSPLPAQEGCQGRQVIPDDLSGYYDSSWVRSLQESPLRVGDNILVQISREPVGIKGAKATRNIKLAGRYIIYMPFVDFVGVSRRIVQGEERLRLETILKNIRRPGQGVLARTFGMGKSESVFRRELEELDKIWKDIQDRYSKKSRVGPCYKESSFVQRILRNIVDDGLDEIWVDTPECMQEVGQFADKFLSSAEVECKLYEGEDGPLFKRFGIEKEWNRALSNKVYLRSGGVINIDQTEAMVSIDVNTGKFVGKKCVEQTILEANLQAVGEIARQLRLRNCGGIIVIDFIDMLKEEHKEEVFQSLLNALHQDRAKYSVMPISGLGLVEMTRKQTRDTLVRVVCAPCHYCGGSGWVKSVSSVCYELVREFKVKLKNRQKPRKVCIYAHPNVIEKLFDKEEFGFLDSMRDEVGCPFEIRSDKGHHIDEYNIVVQD